jgi:aconitate hydratase
MSPEFGCTASYFPPDASTLEYLRLTGRSNEQIELVESYSKANGLWREREERIRYSDTLEVDLGEVEPSLAGPSRPQDRIPLPEVAGTVYAGWRASEDEYGAEVKHEEELTGERSGGHRPTLPPAAVAIAAVTSCTNTSNPEVMCAAGLLARNAVKRGIRSRPWVKTSLAPGSKAVTEYLEKAGLLAYLEALGFHVAGYGCTTCIGNSGDLPAGVKKAVEERGATVAAVLSGNRNFEARIHPKIPLNYLASPPLVVAYALAGSMTVNLTQDPLGHDPNGRPVYLRELWPGKEEIREITENLVQPEMFRSVYAGLHRGDRFWQELESPKGADFEWDQDSEYIREAPFFINLPARPSPPEELKGARALLMLGHSVTTDHISPASRFAPDSPAGAYLLQRGVQEEEFNTYGARRGNHEVMVRGTFANVRLRNRLASKRGGYTKLLPEGREMTVWEAAQEYERRGVPLIILAGKEYGSGSSRDWAAKGTLLLGVRAVIAEGFERIHRSNLVGMGILPLQYREGENVEQLGLSGGEKFDIPDMAAALEPGSSLAVRAETEAGRVIEFETTVRLDTDIEAAYYRNGGVLQYVLRNRLDELNSG